ncbi:hypothetical protein R3W88_029653 [Solanum pinnatisectum]|uniref:Uncharacterized protein n=1 Tax=Solanum pinnatisectum TaxID=50273 RepID=A0AAV9K607_9SOLN|nr:hypothetical protein R3W88_029653 [Solanum pinnatisectum]
MQGHPLIFNVLMENQEVTIVVKNPTFMAQLVPEGVRMVMETYNNHLWMPCILHQPLKYPFPIMTYYHIPIWMKYVICSTQSI